MKCCWLIFGLFLLASCDGASSGPAGGGELQVNCDTITDNALLKNVQAAITAQQLKKYFGEMDSSLSYIPNMHVEGATDTLVKYFKGADTVCFYRGQGNSFVMWFSVSAAATFVAEMCGVKQRKEGVLKQYGLDAGIDTLVIADEEWASYLKIGFDKQAVRTISFYADYVD